MKCPKCQFENREGAKFCGKCRAKLLLVCSQCNSENPPDNVFCDECGQDLMEEQKPKELTPPPEGERKYVTVLFSDLSGYTAMSDKLDPEEVKEIMSRIFGEIAQVVTKYEGFIEKFVGDAVMALFGVPKAHEDDPVRAILAAREIHDLVDGLSPEIEKKIGQPISMHTGVNTGLVVTGEVDMEKGTHGVAGDTINLASRLSSLAKGGEILVGPDTYRQAEGHFTFECLEPTMVKGKADPIQVYKALSQRDKPITIHRLSGLRAELIGRKAEVGQLMEAAESLKEGKGRIFSICGDAGTGKSRLVEDFKATLDLEEIQWFEGHAYAYAQNIPYFPLIDFLNGIFHIEERDSSEKIRKKIESGIKGITGNSREMVPYVGNLYALTYPELEDVSAELWKNRLEEAVKAILTALAKRAPTVFFLEDLHWADRSFVELLRRALLEIRQPAIVLCVYRPPFSLFTSHQLNSVNKLYHEIRLQDLSLSDAQDMLASLLGTENIPSELKRWVQNKAEGNPFYLEELVNTLIESEAMIQENGGWKITRPIAETNISSSIHGLISGRLDRLEKETKRILQEASVIGRAFLYEILIKVSELDDRIDRGLSTLERLDLIRTRSFEPDLEYMFKHPLTQEVVYNGLLKKERQEIHEQVAQVMERLFEDRLSEFYEALAYHFALGRSVNKAVEYLVKAGEKSLARYAVEEAHEYYKKAYDILGPKENKTEEEKRLFTDMLNSWGYVYYCLGEFKEFINLFNSHKALVESLGDQARLGMFYAWLGIAHYMAGQQKDSYDYLRSALELGERSGAQKVVGYACTWLTWACALLGLFDEGIGYGKRAQEIAETFPADQYLFFKSLAGMCFIYFWQGNTKKLFEGAKRLLDYGEKTANSRSKVFGHFINAAGHLATGDMALCRKESEKTVGAALDPFYLQFGKLTLGQSYFFDGQLQEAEGTFELLLNFCEKRGVGSLSGFANLFVSTILIAKGNMKQGFRKFEETQEVLLKSHMKLGYAQSEYILGVVYTQFITGPSPGLATLAKNIGFIVKNAPFAEKKAEQHFNKAIELLRKMGAKGILGQALLGLGQLYKAKKRNEQARECFSEAVHLFTECDAHIYLKQVKGALTSLE
ncbi:MAG: AAA family ATPase [Desulfobacteraceae bacterium]|nr:MAG: AAA family ATPase [Desulfobacteraceae bacterium]